MGDQTPLNLSVEGPDEWKARQESSKARYSSDHYNEDPRPALMFGNFIGTTLHRNAAVLDIGCGISPELPHYVEELGLTGYLGLEPLDVPVEREYPCIIGMAEEIPLDDNSIDAVIFATSFDHIADDSKAIDETKRVLKPGGVVYMWQSIHDPDTLAIISTLHRLRRGPHMIPIVTLQAAKTSYLMAKRKRDLRDHNRLDTAHERWFTRDGLRQSFGRWGFTIVRELEPYGMASMFIEARR